MPRALELLCFTTLDGRRHLPSRQQEPPLAQNHIRIEFGGMSSVRGVRELVRPLDVSGPNFLKAAQLVQDHSY